MGPDWKALAPHRPLEPGALEYVASPSRLGESIARRVLAGGSTILVGGPAGVGKSTELARAAQLLEHDRFVCLVQVDRTENMRRLTSERLMWRITERVAELVQVRGLSFHQRILDSLTYSKNPSLPVRVVPGATELAQLALNEAARHSGLSVTLLIDGMEKVVEGPDAAELFEALGSLPEAVEIVTVIPWHVAFGPNAAQVVRPGEHLVTARGLALDERSHLFFHDLLHRRIGDLSTDFGEVVYNAAEMSGGLPRMFLQLVADAATYVNLGRREGSGWPSQAHLDRAAADMTESLRRMLLPGDREALRKVDGTDGTELDPARKVRLMAHGLLLERTEGRNRVLRPHPLLPLESSVRAA